MAASYAREQAQHSSSPEISLSTALNPNRKSSPGDIFMDAPKKEEKEDLTGLFDLAIPLSTPVTVIRELVEKFELDLVKRNGKMDMTGEVMDREILVLRGDLETVMSAKKYMFEAIDKKIEEWEKNERSEKYKKYYEARLKENADAKEQEGDSPEPMEQSIDWTSTRD
jgi:hypothetical protein